MSVVWILLVLVSGVLAPILAPYDPLAQNLAIARNGPDGEHWLGTDSLGRDVLSRLMYGGLSTLGGVATAITVAVVLGLVTGVVAGYTGGWFDVVTLRVADALQALPGIIILLMMVAIFGSDLGPAMTALGVLLSAQFYRLARGGAKEVRTALFVDSARVAGVSGLNIVARHILPNMIRPIIVQASLMCSVVILMQAGLSFLGLGPPPPSPQWGSLVQEASSVIGDHPWLMVPSGAAITLTALAFNMLGDALTDSATPLAAKAVTIGPASTRKDRQVAQQERSEASPLLEVAGLTVAFPVHDHGLTRVVEDVSFRVEQGETVALVGESGCGKTVTALSLAGLLPSNASVANGSVLFHGREFAGASEAAWSQLRGRSIGFISQEPMQALDPAFTVGGQLANPLRRLKNLSRREAREHSVALLEKVGIAHPESVAKKYPHQLSGGMAQRVSIAIALAGDPELLIADEPTTALDTTVQAEILDLLRQIQRETGAALILVTHDWGVVADVADRAVVMYAGEVVEMAGDEIFSDPRHPYTAALLRSAPRMEHAGQMLPTIPGSVPPPKEWPTSCHFQNRCPFVTPECREDRIPLATLEGGRVSRCIRIDELRDRLDG